jgi:glycosyltransferase involved in cell wall biosynthesis
MADLDPTTKTSELELAVDKNNEGYLYDVSIVMPCLNEENTVGICIEKAIRYLKEKNINGEVIVSDNGSTDNSRIIAQNSGAKVVEVKEIGYGNALNKGISNAKGKYIIIGDSDNSYDFSDLDKFLEKLKEGYDLVVGNRFASKIDPKAMPLLNRYIGNPFLTGIGKLFFNISLNDFHCGMRALTKKAFEKMDLRTTGMEYASEMIVKASLLSFKITEVPIHLFPDGRMGKSHLKPLRDGWRHLRFLLLYSPRWLFFYPGLTMMFLGFFVAMLILPRNDVKIDIHTMLFAVTSVMIGAQAVIFAVFTRTFAIHEKLLPKNKQIEQLLNKFTLEKGLFIGLILVLIGLIGGIYIYIIWLNGDFFKFGISFTMRIVIASVMFLMLGFQIIFSSFFFNFLKINTK